MLPAAATGTPTAIEIKDQEHWRELRYGTIGASESAALFESVTNESPIEPQENDDFDYVEDGEPVSPYLSPLALWALKTRRIQALPKSDNARTAWGTAFEPVIAQMIAGKNGWSLHKPTVYFMHPRVPRMGASLDYQIDVNDGTGLLYPFEIKNVEGNERWKWRNAAGEWVVPGHILIQVQHQLAVTGMPKAYVGVLFGGAEDRVFEVPRDDALIAEIEAAVQEFWWYVDNDTQPEANAERDSWVIRRLYQHADPEKVVDWSDDQEARELVAMLKHYNAQANAAKKEADRIRNQLMLKLGDAGHAYLGDAILSATTVAGGQVTYYREPYRNMRVKKPTAKHGGRPIAQILNSAASDDADAA